MPTYVPKSFDRTTTNSGAAVRPHDSASAANFDFMPYFMAMSDSLGPMQWWPARTPFEVIVGAILTQNTSWKNVELAVANLRRARVLTPGAIGKCRASQLQSLIRPAGYFRQKSKTLKAFVRFLDRDYGGSLKKMFRASTVGLRDKLLEVRGIGPETADCILLYAGGHPTFVVDTYTHRILERHGLADGKRNYEETRARIENSLPRDAAVLNQLHALIVSTGKNWCYKSEPNCTDCPLRTLLPAASFGSPSSISIGRIDDKSVSMDASV